MLSQCIQHILLKMHQYRVQILYKPGPELFIADWLSWHNLKEGTDEPIQDMDIRVDAIQSTIDIPELCPYHRFNRQWCRMNIFNV